MRLTMTQLWLLCSVFVIGTAWSQVKGRGPKSQLFESLKQQPSNSKMRAPIHADRGTRDETIRFGKEILPLENTDPTTVLLLDRDCAMDINDLDRAGKTAQSAVDRLAYAPAMKSRRDSMTCSANSRRRPQPIKCRQLASCDTDFREQSRSCLRCTSASK
jgi:hypothetical protein